MSLRCGPGLAACQSGPTQPASPLPSSGGCVAQWALVAARPEAAVDGADSVALRLPHCEVPGPLGGLSWHLCVGRSLASRTLLALGNFPGSERAAFVDPVPGGGGLGGDGPAPTAEALCVANELRASRVLTDCHMVSHALGK
eukprot:1068051-Prymnesium_polylepis.1